MSPIDFWRARIAKARIERQAYQEQWLNNAKIASGASWVAWYKRCLHDGIAHPPPKD